MVKPTLLEETPMNIIEVREELAKIEKRDKELSFRANKANEYLNSIVTLKPKDAKELYKKIEDLNIPRLKAVHIHKIIDILPATVEVMKTIVQSYTLTVNNDNLKKIIGIVSEYQKKV